MSDRLSLSLPLAAMLFVFSASGSSSSLSLGFSWPLSDREATKLVLLISLLDDWVVSSSGRDVHFWTPIPVGGSLVSCFTIF